MPRPVFLFDYDGTIADTLVVYERAIGLALEALGLPPFATREALLRLFDDNMTVGLRRLGLADAQIRELFERLTPPLAEAQDGVALFPGVAALLRTLAEHAHVAVVTSNVGAVVRPRRARDGLLDCVEDVVGSDVEPSKIRKIRSFQARVPAGTPVHYVGDTLGDMLEGRAAGAITVAVAWGWHSPERMRPARPDVVARSPRDILALGRIPGQRSP
jgi:phosphoglycolate phosphatase